VPFSVDDMRQRLVLLCIDDSQDVLECEKSFLESFGFAVLTAPSADANRWLRAHMMHDNGRSELPIADSFLSLVNIHTECQTTRRF